MIFSSIQVSGYRSIADSGELPLGPVSLLVGRNNAGKSSLLRALYSLQSGSSLRSQDIRFGSQEFRIDLRTSPDFVIPHSPNTRKVDNLEEGKLTAVFKEGGDVRMATQVDSRGQSVGQWTSVEPGNLIYPIFSGRVQSSYEQQVRRDQAFSVMPSDANIVARVAALAASQVSEAGEFRDLCTKVLGLNLSVILGENGQRLGTPLDRFNEITLEAMGAGITSALNLLVSLSGAKGKLFLIEEPENDLHPQALKALLELIVEASKENQFIITTHSSIVLGCLGSLSGAVVIKAESRSVDGIPTTDYSVIDGPTERLEVLRHLGYELADFDLGEGWLIFEESSAERLAREWLIPWFAPGLSRLRTLAAAGTSRVNPIMEDFREIFLFAHLEPVYRNRAWVLVDGDVSGKRVVSELRDKFKDWSPGNFLNFSEDDVERYYPARFQAKVGEVLGLANKKLKRERKRQLLREVLVWIDSSPDEAKREFSESAAELISVFKGIEVDLQSYDRI